MRKKIWGALIIILAIIIIALIIFFLFFYNPSSAPTTEQPVTSNNTAQPKPAGSNGDTTVVKPVFPPKKAEVKADDLARMASAFAERFGSFSNQSDFGNLRDLRIFMTGAMKNWSDNYMNEAKVKRGDTSIYFGVVTKSILTEVKQFDGGAGRAEILVKTQRRESTGVAANSAAYYQDILIKYLRQANVWLVDGAIWQEK